MRRIGSILLAVGVVALAVVYGLLGIVLAAVLRTGQNRPAASATARPPTIPKETPSHPQGAGRERKFRTKLDG